MREMGLPVSEELESGSLSVADVWSFYTRFQGVKLYDFGTEKSEDNQIHAASRSIIRLASSAMSERTFRLFNMNCAQLYELFDFLSELNIPYYTGILASHKITSVSQLALLSDSCSTKAVQLIAEKGCRHAHTSSLASELVKLRAAVVAAKASPLSKSLNSRFENFIDSDASLVTVLQSSCLFEIVLSKKVLLAFGFAFCFVCACWTVWSMLVPSNYSTTQQNFIVFQSQNLFIWLFQMLSLLIAHVKSPRQGKYWLSFSFFLWFSSSLYIYGVSVSSAVYDGCRQCVQTNPAILSLNSTVLNILNLPCWPPVFAAVGISMLYKQRIIVPVTLYTYSVTALTPIFVSIFSVPTASNVVFTLTSGSYSAPMFLFWFLLYLMFRMFLRKGNQLALDSYYKRNAATLNMAFANIKHDMNGLRFLTCHQQFLEAASTHSSQPIVHSGFLHLNAPMLRDVGLNIVNARARSDEFNESIRNLEMKKKHPIVQSYASFESLIRDAEFINCSFQEWVSTWLNSGFDSDASRKFLCINPDDSEHPCDESRSEGETSSTIRGFHIPGPVKHIDRAIAKVTSNFCAVCTTSFLCDTVLFRRHTARTRAASSV
jgi:hypothetical protein